MITPRAGGSGPGENEARGDSGRSAQEPQAEETTGVALLSLLEGCSEGPRSPHASIPPSMRPSGSFQAGQLVRAQAGNHCQRVMLLWQGPCQATWPRQASSIWTRNPLRLTRRPRPGQWSPSPLWARVCFPPSLLPTLLTLGPPPWPSHPNAATRGSQSSVRSLGQDAQVLGCSPRLKAGGQPVSTVVLEPTSSASLTKQGAVRSCRHLQTSG